MRMINAMTRVPINFFVANKVTNAIKGLDLKNKSEGRKVLYGNAA
jgi:hypothetical protein